MFYVLPSYTHIGNFQICQGYNTIKLANFIGWNNSMHKLNVQIINGPEMFQLVIYFCPPETCFLTNINDFNYPPKRKDTDWLHGDVIWSTYKLHCHPLKLRLPYFVCVSLIDTHFPQTLPMQNWLNSFNGCRSPKHTLISSDNQNHYTHPMKAPVKLMRRCSSPLSTQSLVWWKRCMIYVARQPPSCSPGIRTSSFRLPPRTRIRWIP